MQRKGLKDHPKVEFAGFCDTDETMFARIEDYHGDGYWTVTDYREAFADKVDDFDAVIVDTPDHHHCPMMVTALKHGKHVYGQKPLVHQLDELRLIREAVAARPRTFRKPSTGISGTARSPKACLTARIFTRAAGGLTGKPGEACLPTGDVT